MINMASIRVAINGVTGKMGKQVLAQVCNEPDIEPVGAICRQDCLPSIELPDGSNSIPLSNDLSTILVNTRPDVLIDFTTSESLMAAAEIAAEHKVNIVTGTTGITEKYLNTLKLLAAEKNIGIVYSPNFALGAVLIKYLSRTVARFFEYVEIIESHHEAKVDSPSGTSLDLAKAISDEANFEYNQPSKEVISGSRGANYDNIAIHSMRVKGISGRHEVVFGDTGQTIRLIHDTLGRECYMPGVIQAVRHVMTSNGLTVGLEKILGIE